MDIEFITISNKKINTVDFVKEIEKSYPIWISENNKSIQKIITNSWKRILDNLMVKYNKDNLNILTEIWKEISKDFIERFEEFNKEQYVPYLFPHLLFLTNVIKSK